METNNSQNNPHSLSELSIKTLPHRLFIFSIERGLLDSCIKPLLKLGFFSDQSSTFLSFTDTEEEVSFILDEKSLLYFKETVGESVPFSVLPDCWRAIQVDEGASFIDATGIVSNLSAPLTEAGIGMLYLSAYECDLILVKESQVEKAVSCLFNKIFVNDSYSETKEKKNSCPSLQIVANTIPTRLALATLKSNTSLERCTHSILRQFFFPSNPNNRFFSFFSPSSKPSLILDYDAISSFPKEVLLVHNDCWRAIHVPTESATGYSSTNVSLLSSTLANDGISIYYLSTCNTDFILVSEKHLEAAIKCLKKFGVMF